ASAGIVVGCYFAYWHDGFIFGPRFVFVLLPVLVLWTARLPALVALRVRGESPTVEGETPGVAPASGERAARTSLARRAVLFAYLVAAGLAATVSIPIRARDYARALVSMRLDYLGAARRAGVERAVILVRESWGT